MVRICVVLAVFAPAAFIGGCGASITSFSEQPILNVGATGGHYYLPRTIFNVRVEKSDDGSTFTIGKVTEADPRARLRYQFEPSGLSDDIIEVSIAENGLLTAVSSNTTDRSGDIAVKVAELVFTTATGGAALPAGRELPSTPVAGKTLFTASYDPFDSHESWQVRRAMARLDTGYCVLVGLETALEPAVACSSQIPQIDSRIFVDYAARASGIFYRRPSPVPIRIFRKAAGDWAPLFVGNESLFEKSTLYQIAVVFDEVDSNS